MKFLQANFPGLRYNTKSDYTPVGFVQDAAGREGAHIMSTCQEDRMIYHYCSTSGFFNILRNQCLWLTEASFTNGAWENRMLDPVFEQALTGLVETGEIQRAQVEQHGNCITAIQPVSSIWAVFRKKEISCPNGVRMPMTGRDSPSAFLLGRWILTVPQST